MKKHIILPALLMLAGKVFAQDFKLRKTDSLHIQFNEGYIMIGMPNFASNYDSVFEIMSVRLNQLIKSQILPANDNAWPLEIRYIKNEEGEEFLKYYSEPEDNANWNDQITRMQILTEPHPMGDWRIYIADIENHIKFTLISNDSFGIQRLLKKPLHGLKDSILIEVKQFQSRKADVVFYQYNKDVTHGRSVSAVEWQGVKHYNGKISWCPSLISDQPAIGFGFEFDYLHYKKLVPNYKLGVVWNTYVSNISSDKNKISNLSFTQLKYTWLWAENKTWLGVKIGLGHYVTGSPAFQGGLIAACPKCYGSGYSFVYGVSFENTRLVDFDIDVFVPIRKYQYSSTVTSPTVLTVKLPF